MDITDAPGQGFNLRNHSGDRSAGVHLSQVIRVIAVKGGILKAESDDLGEMIEETDPAHCGENSNLLRLAVGIAWEEWLEKQCPWISFHPGEIEKDGIIATPDGIGMIGKSAWVEEFKTTKKSAMRPIKDAWLWWEQCRGYCHMLGLTEAVLRVLYLCGDYRGNQMLYRSYKAKFTEEELEMSWRRILAYKDQVVPEKGKGKASAA